MKKKNFVMRLLLLTTAAVFGLAGCSGSITENHTIPPDTTSNGTASDILNAIELPNEYLITYEIESPDGVITFLRKGLDSDGNVYFSYNGDEMLFLATGITTSVTIRMIHALNRLTRLQIPM